MNKEQSPKASDLSFATTPEGETGEWHFHVGMCGAANPGLGIYHPWRRLDGSDTTVGCALTLEDVRRLRDLCDAILREFPSPTARGQA